MEQARISGIIGQAIPRIDSHAKVTGAALYGADFGLARMSYAQLATSPIALGRILTIDDKNARAIPGVLEIFTFQNVGKSVRPGKTLLQGGHMASSVAPLYCDKIYFAGQITALVVAETLEAAEEAAAALVFTFEEEKPTTAFGGPASTQVKAKSIGETELKKGDFEKAFAAAAFTVDAEYETPAQHHNPLELFQTTCAWKGEELTVWESTQSVKGTQFGLAKQLNTRPKNIRVISPFIGGAFGSRGELAQSTALVAFASKQLQRPVKLVVTREQGFTLRTYRAETRHRVRLGADADGKLQGLSHQGWELCARRDHFSVPGIESTARAYACPNIHAEAFNVEADRQSSGFMRAPPETPYMFALESAVDELAHKMKIDPVEFRLRNDTQVESIKGLPFSSRSLRQCFETAALAFGWEKRNPKPGSMREGDWLIGWGCATAMYPTQIAPALCRVTLLPEGKAIVESGAHDIGTGMYTIVAQTAADQLGLTIDEVEVNLGDSSLPAAPMTAGSTGSASICSVVVLACEEIRQKLASKSVSDSKSPLHGYKAKEIVLEKGFLRAPDGKAEALLTALARAGGKKGLVVLAKNNPDGAPPLIGPMLVSRGVPVIVGGTAHKDRVQYAFGAQFVEVRVHRHTGVIRAPRLVGAYAGGRILNPRTATNQLAGGQVWGLSSALFEASELGAHSARYENNNLADYLIPVNADIGEVTTLLVPEEDKFVNSLGIKGVGELGIVGMNAAVANAVFHATGVRQRKLPLRLEQVLLSEDHFAQLQA